jgi:hypothetical protein
MGVLETELPAAAGQTGWLYSQSADAWTKLEHPEFERSMGSSGETDPSFTAGPGSGHQASDGGF